MSEAKVLLKDTLSSPDGKYSRKSVTMFVSMGMLVALTWVETISSMPILEQYRMSVSDSSLWLFGSMVSGLAGITVWDKKNSKE